MPLDLTAVGRELPPSERAWTSTDALLYAVAVGAGAEDPAAELAFTTENTQGVPQQVLPTFAVLVGNPWDAFGSLGPFDFGMLVHAEQSVELAGPLPPEGRVRTTTRVVDIQDKGSGALVAFEARSDDAASGAHRFTVRASVFIRGEGGFGGPRKPSAPRAPWPERPADVAVTYATRRDQALLYRLTGDRNPLHTDPALARRAGFPRPILHGLCTYGFAGRALLQALCGGDPARFGGLEARFTRPVLPGDTLTVRAWVQEPAGGGSGGGGGGPAGALFRVETQGGEVVVDGGRLTLR